MRSKASIKTLVLQKAFVALIFLVSFTFQQLGAQAKQTPEYQVKAAFLYNFTKFIDWPSNAFNSSESPFTIGIIGDNPFGSYFEELIAGEKIGSHPIAVKYYKDVKEITECHVLFVNTHDVALIKKVLTSLRNRSILTVSDASSFARNGGMIRFYKAENKIRLEINVASIKSAQLSVSSKLLSVSRIIDPRGK